MALVLSVDEAKEELQRVHELSWGGNDVSLYRRLHSRGTTKLRWQRKPLSYNLLAAMPEAPRYKWTVVRTINSRVERALREVILSSYNQLHRVLPNNRSDAMKIKRESLRFFVERGQLFGRGLDQAPLRCISSDEVTRMLREVHEGDCSEL